ncbi:MAG: hypothetical protein M3327_09750 [Actinomycetota bacterium]|nr:hypothetical protein [Actinomycetota bacterium]
MASIAIRSNRPATAGLLSISGPIRIAIVDVTMSASYTTGGETVNFAGTQLAGRTILAVNPCGNPGGYWWEYDYTSTTTRTRS